MGAKQRILEYLDSKGVSRNKFYTVTGLSNGYLDSGVDINTAKLSTIVEHYPDLNLEYVISGEGSPILPDGGSHHRHDTTAEDSASYSPKQQRVPLYDVEATAGTVTVFDDLMNQGPIDQISIPDLPKCDGAVYIRGDSMYPILKSGDIVVYKIMHDKLNSFIWGEMYLLSISVEGDTMVTAKYVQKSQKSDHIKLVSHNPHHQEVEIHIDNVLSFAIIKVSIRKNTI